MNDLDAFRPYLFSIAYRMLGDAGEAEDMVQDAFLRYLSSAPDTVDSPRSYLATIVTRLCLDQLKSARVTRTAYHGPWLPSPVPTADLAPGPEEQVTGSEDVSLAFLMLLERLTPHERAAFVLREAFDYRYDDIAGVLGNSSAAARKLVQRARERIGQPKRERPVSLDDQRRLAERFLDAARRGDLQQLEQVLAADVSSWVDGGENVRAARRPIVGRHNVARQQIGLLERIFPGLEFSFALVNGGVGILWWSGDRLINATEVEIRDGAIVGLWMVLNPAKLAYLRRRVSPPARSSA